MLHPYQQGRQVYAVFVCESTLDAGGAAIAAGSPPGLGAGSAAVGGVPAVLQQEGGVQRVL